MQLFSSSISSARGVILSALAIALVLTGCTSKESKAREAVADLLKNQGVRDLKVDMFHPSKESPDKAYVSVTVTYNFATGDGSFQREMLGYILKQEGKGYSIEQNTAYTTDENKADILLSGRKR